MAVNFQQLNTSNFATAQQLQALINDSTQGADTTYSSNKIVGITGALSSLNTTQKGSLVGAVNEVDGNVGNLAQLSTAQKGSLVGAVNEVDGNTDELFYSVGETEQISFYGGAFITSSLSRIFFTISCKNLKNVSSVNFSDSNIIVVQNSDYIAGAASSPITTGFSVVATIVNENTLRISVTFDDPLTATNNSAVGVLFNSTISFE